MCCPSPDRAHETLSALTRFVNLLISGHTPSSILPHLCGATLLACKKKNGGLRPVAFGEILRRLVSKCLALAALPGALSVLSPLQLGVNVKGGCEAIIHAVSHIMSSVPSTQKWTLLLDFSNAFNSISRQAMFEQLLDGVLLLLPTHSTFGPAHHSQLQWSSAGGPNLVPLVLP